MRVSFYVDGFNLFYGRLKPNPSVKWLDLDALARRLRPGDDISIRYFTSRVKGHSDAGSPGRQKLYLNALATTPAVSVHFGRFRTHPKLMAVVNPPPGGARFVTVHKTEEKGSDVNLATFLLVDGFDRRFDEAVVLSNDGDLVEAIAQTNARFGPVHVLNPHHPDHVYELKQVAASYRGLELSDLRARP